MSFVTPADRDYVKACIQKIRDLAFQEGRCIGMGDMTGADRHRQACDAEQARLEAFVEGISLEKGKGSE